MSGAKEFKFSLKVMINGEKTQVLFTEADSVDVLLSFLTLPLGKIVRLLKDRYGHTAPRIGSLTNLYDGLSNLDSVHFWSKGCKQKLLNPKSSFEAECLKLKLNPAGTKPVEYVPCGDKNCKRKRSPVESNDPRKCPCVKLEPKTGNDGDGGVFTRKTTSFLIGDNLRMVANVPGSIKQTLLELGVIDVSGAELRTVTFGFHEIMGMLYRSLLTQNPLTETVLYDGCNVGKVIAINFGMFMRTARRYSLHELKEVSTSDSKKMTVKAILHKPTNKLLFAQSEEDFVDFLFSLLVIPLGGVECLLDRRSALRPVDNLYTSLGNLNADKCLRSHDTKDRLLRPELPSGYLSKNLMFSLTEQSAPCPPKGEQSYVKKPGMFMVTDDLNVTPLSMASTISAMNMMRIPLSDVKEMELHIGLTEALSILKASLSSIPCFASHPTKIEEICFSYISFTRLLLFCHPNAGSFTVLLLNL